MRNNNNSRHMRPRNNNNNGRSNNNNSNSNNNGYKRVNPKIQTFDSNGPDVRVRGTAYQINEKYLSLAKDAASSGDRILAESYLQHAEHYQRFINEMSEKYEQYRQQNQQIQGKDSSEETDETEGAEGSDSEEAEPLNDLDQSFLVGNNRNSPTEGSAEVLSLTGIVANSTVTEIDTTQVAPITGDDQPTEVKEVRKRRVLSPKPKAKEDVIEA